MSIWTDSETKSFAEEIGAVAFMDKAELGLTLTTAIRDFQGHQDFLWLTPSPIFASL